MNKYKVYLQDGDTVEVEAEHYIMDYSRPRNVLFFNREEEVGRVFNPKAIVKVNE